MPIAMHAPLLASIGLAFVSLGREWAGTLAESSQRRQEEEEEEGRWRSGRTESERGQGRIACLTHQTLAAQFFPSFLPHPVFFSR